MKKFVLIISILQTLACFTFSQEKPKDVTQMTKEDVMALTYDQLLEMPFEDLLKLAEIVGVSLDELYEMILNKDVVSASKKVESSFESPLSTSVVSYQEIIESGARNIEEALRLIPGLIVREKTNGNFDMHIRGNDNLPPNQLFVYSENSNTLVMIDSRPVYNYVHGGTFWETLPIDIEDIERIEVVRGPSSALYGPNAVSGVVNIITKRKVDKKITVGAMAQGGMQNSGIANLAFGTRINEKLSLRMTGNFQTLGRSTDKLYVHKAGRFLSPEELDTIPDPGNPAYFIFDPADDLNLMFPHPERARQRYGANAYLFYDVGKNSSVDLKAGYQYSDVISSTMGDNPMSVAGRLSSTYYTDLTAKIKDFHAQVNILSGWQDIVREDTGFKVNLLNVNSNFEYDFHIGRLDLRPGFSYQLTTYDDLPYLRYEGQGFLNGKKKLTTAALSLRGDYKLNDRFRLIGAVRGEKFSSHDDFYLSYQFVAAYNINNIHNLRLVYSKANRGPFMVDTYADYFWDREGRPIPRYIYFRGQKNLDMLTMSMFEAGYRIKPSKKLQADFELFYTKAKDFGALYPDSANINDRLPYVRMTYANINLESTQIGITSVVTYIFTKDLVLKVFGTFQQTDLKNVIPYVQDETVMMMLQAAFLGTGYSVNFTNMREDHPNKATPAFTGGLVVNWKPFDKLNINLNGNFYSKQQFISKYAANVNEPFIIDPLLIINVKMSYQLFKNLDVFINARNLPGGKQQFAYMDNINALILGGVTFNLK